MDIDNIPYGTDFRAHIQTVWRQTDLLVVVIGPGWLGNDGAGGIRMSQETDPVRSEVEAALARDLPMIPVLVDGARMPDSSVLPVSFKDFSFLNAAEVATGRDFHPHIDRLIAAIDKTLAAHGIIVSPPEAPAGASGSSARPAVAAVSPAPAPRSWPVDLVRYLIVPTVILLVAHHLIIDAYDLGNDYLRVVTVAVPLAFGFLLFWLAGRGTGAAVFIAAVQGLVAASGMTVAVALYSGEPILPQNRVEWIDNIEVAVTIALSFIAGHVLAHAAALAMRRKRGT